MKEHMSQTGYERAHVTIRYGRAICHNQVGKGHISQSGRGGAHITNR